MCRCISGVDSASQPTASNPRREHIIKPRHFIPLGWLSQRTLPYTPTTQKKGPVPIYTHPTTTTAPPVSSRAICCRSPPAPGNTRTHKRISDLRQGGGRRPNKLTDLTACDSLAVRGTDTTAAGSAGKRTPPHTRHKNINKRHRGGGGRARRGKYPGWLACRTPSCLPIQHPPPHNPDPYR